MLAQRTFRVSKVINTSVRGFACCGHSHGPPPKNLGDDAKRITWIGICCNLGLSSIKAIAGVSSHSAGLIADAAHSMSDLVSDGVTLAAVKFARKKPDSKFPYGFGKFEALGALAVSQLLVGGAFGIGLHSYHLFTTLMNDPSGFIPVTGSIALGAAVLSILVKEALYQSTIKIGEKERSQVLIANAWHHRSDCFSSIVAAGGILASCAGFPYFDPLAGMAVGLMIGRTGVQIGWQSMLDLADVNQPETLEEVNECLNVLIKDGLKNINGQVSIRAPRARRIGPFTEYEVHLVCPSDTPLDVADRNADMLSSALRNKFEQLGEVRIIPEIECCGSMTEAATTISSLDIDPHACACDTESDSSSSDHSCQCNHPSDENELPEMSIEKIEEAFAASNITNVEGIQKLCYHEHESRWGLCVHADVFINGDSFNSACELNSILESASTVIKEVIPHKVATIECKLAVRDPNLA